MSKPIHGHSIRETVMHINKTIQAFFVLILSCTFLSSAYAAWPVLNNADMQKFVQTFPAMYREYKALGLNVNPQTGQVDGSDRLMWKKEVQRVLNQNGWDFRFWKRTL